MKCFSKFLLLCSVMFALGSGAAYAAGLETLNVGLPGDAVALDTMQAVDTISFSVARHISEPLVTVDGKTKEIVPVLAEKWELIDPQTYKFYLRKGVKFHNGEPLTAADVVFSLTRAATDSVHAKARGKFIDVNGFQIIDDHTLIVKTNGTVGGWLETMKHPYAIILNKKAFEAVGADYFRSPVGTGPFKFKSWTKGERIELEAFDDYYGKKPNFKNLNFLVIPDDSSRVIALETGKVDMTYAVPATDIERLNAPGSKVQAVKGQGLVMIYFGMNTQKKPLDDPRVRKAIDYAINKEAYNQVVYQGLSNIPTGPLPPAAGYLPQPSKAYPYDIEKVKALLKEANYDFSIPLKLWVINFQDRINGATVIQSMLSQVGIKVEIEVFEAGVFDDRMKDGAHHMIIHTWGMQTNRDTGHYWLSLFQSQSIGNTNRTFLKDELIDELLNNSNATIETAKRNEFFQQIWERLDELHPMIGLSVPSELYGGRKDLVGLEDLYDGRINYLGNISLK
ncbi:diguanylate phosphodiesterase [Synergistales bacterium]|nr:diguanylate phosphodiesterase [Synergistales bacterium]